MQNIFGKLINAAAVLSILLVSIHASAALLTNPDDPRSWQGATVGTFAQLFYGANTLANRQLVITNQLLDDGVFNQSGFSASTLVHSVGQYSGQGGGASTDLTGTGSYGYTCCGPAASRFTAANAIDNLWMQTSGVVGETVWALGGPSATAVIFNTIDHGPLPEEAIESTVYLSNSISGPWTQAVTQRVWLEGFMANTGILWDGFTYAVGTGTSSLFSYASIIHGGPGALIADGDNEINGILGATSAFTPINATVPEPSVLALLGLGFIIISAQRRKAK